MLYILITIAVAAIAYLLIIGLAKIQEATDTKGSTLGGCITIIIIIAAILLLLYLYDVMGGSYDLNTPVRRSY